MVILRIHLENRGKMTNQKILCQIFLVTLILKVMNKDFQNMQGTNQHIMSRKLVEAKIYN